MPKHPVQFRRRALKSRIGHAYELFHEGADKNGVGNGPDLCVGKGFHWMKCGYCGERKSLIYEKGRKRFVGNQVLVSA